MNCLGLYHHTSVEASIYQPTRLLACPSTSLLVYPSAHLPAYQSTCLPVYLAYQSTSMTETPTIKMLWLAQADCRKERTFHGPPTGKWRMNKTGHENERPTHWRRLWIVKQTRKDKKRKCSRSTDRKEKERKERNTERREMIESKEKMWKCIKNNRKRYSRNVHIALRNAVNWQGHIPSNTNIVVWRHVDAGHRYIVNKQFNR